MKITIKEIRDTVRSILQESVISDEIKRLQQFEQQEKDIEALFPGAIEVLIADNIMDQGHESDAELVVSLLTQGSRERAIAINTQSGFPVLVAADKHGEEYAWDADNAMWVHEISDPVGFEKLFEPRKAKKTEQECPDCAGTGEWAGLFKMNKCKTCNGTGKVIV